MADNQEKKLHPFCFPDMEKEYARSSVQEIAPDVWQIEGCIGFSFFLSPPSSNVYILRDGDMVFMLDAGVQPFYRSRILEVLRTYVAKGAKTLVLMDTQGHWDHAMNNDVVLEAGFDKVRFLLPEPEVPVIETPTHWLGDFRMLEYYYEPYRDWIPLLQEIEQYARAFPTYQEPAYQEVWRNILALTDDKSGKAFRSAIRLLLDRVILPGKRSLAECAEVLTLDGREKRRFGDTEFYGWQVGRFFIIHDGSHSPGHVCLYDPLNRLALTGDVTVEINPPFYDSTFEKCITAAAGLRRMAEQGFIALASDSHRSPTWFPEVVKGIQIEPLHPVELADAARSQEECVGFFLAFEDFYRELRDETLSALARLGEATIPEIVTELFTSPSKAVQFKKALPFPSRPEVLVVDVLKDNGFNRRVDGDRILFSPPQRWRF